MSHPVAGENANVGSIVSKPFYSKMKNEELVSTFTQGQQLLKYYVEETAKTLYWRAYKSRIANIMRIRDEDNNLIALPRTVVHGTITRRSR